MMHDRFFNTEELEKGGAKKQGKDSWKKLLPLKAYIDKKGAYLPADNIRMMLIGNKARKGAVDIQGSMFESQKGKKYKTLAMGAIWVVGPEDPLRVYIEPIRKTFDDYDERTFVNPKTGRGIVRRPIFNVPWTLTFIVQVTDDRLTDDFVKNLFEVAGLYCGAGAYGPTFGRCIIEKWEEYKT
jgi:hypothetical protein